MGSIDMSNRIPCTNNCGPASHIAGTDAAIACQAKGNKAARSSVNNISSPSNTQLTAKQKKADRIKRDFERRLKTIGLTLDVPEEMIEYGALYDDYYQTGELLQKDVDEAKDNWNRGYRPVSAYRLIGQENLTVLGKDSDPFMGNTHGSSYPVRINRVTADEHIGMPVFVDQEEVIVDTPDDMIPIWVNKDSVPNGYNHYESFIVGS